MELEDIFNSESIFVGGAQLGLKATDVLGVRELTAEEIAGLDDYEPEEPSKTPALKQLRGTHHKLAQMLADGIKNVDAARMLGFSESRISILKADPSFRALVDHYRGVKDAAFQEFSEKMANLGADALDVLAERVHEAPEKIATETLLAIATSVADRTGHGKQVKIDSRTITLSAEDLERMKNTNVENVSKITQENRGSRLGEISLGTSGGDSAESELTRLESPRESVREESAEGIAEEGTG